MFERYEINATAMPNGGQKSKPGDKALITVEITGSNSHADIITSINGQKQQTFTVDRGQLTLLLSKLKR